MVTKDEINKIIQWCEQKKMERGRIYLIERNPFKDEITWVRRFPLIEIDRPKEVAAKTSLVYDSTIGKLWQFINGSWRQIIPEMKIE